MENLKLLIRDGIPLKNQIATDFFEQVYFPNKLRLRREDQPLPQNSLLIASDYNLSVIKEGKIEIFGDNGFGLVIKQ